MLGDASERILISRDIVDLQRDHTVDSNGFEQLRDVAHRDRVARLGLTILTRVTEIGNHGRDARRGCVTKTTDKEQETAQLVVYALLNPAPEPSQHVNIAVPDADKRPRLVLAILEFAKFVGRELDAQIGGHPGSEWVIV